MTPPTPEQIEAVARAICTASPDPHNTPLPCPSECEHCLNTALAAITAYEATKEKE